MLSIIVPTLNEEKYLPGLFESIKGQNSDVGFEIIVADAGSKDRTIEIAKNFGCKITSGGLPAKGRNEGAKVAQGNLLLFLDADLLLPKDFLRNSLDEFKKRKLGVASYRLIPKTENLLIRIGFDFFYNWPITLSQRIVAAGAMGILVKKELFDRVGGFDEEIKLAEDHYFVQQASKISRFGIISSARIFMPLRRFERDGYLKTCVRYLLCGIHMFIFGPVKSDVLGYKFNHYSKNEENKIK